MKRKLVSNEIALFLGGWDHDLSMYTADVNEFSHTGTKLNITQLPVAKRNFRVCHINNNVYVIGGELCSTLCPIHTVHKYNVITNTWTYVTTLPMDEMYIRFYCVAIGSIMYILWQPHSYCKSVQTQIIAYDTVLDIWSIVVEQTPVDVTYTCAVDHSIFMCSSFGQCVQFDTIARTWTHLPKIPTQQELLEFCVLNGLLYVACRYLYRYEFGIWIRVGTNHWPTTPTLFVIDGIMHARIQEIETFDPMTLSWNQTKLHINDIVGSTVCVVKTGAKERNKFIKV